MTTKKSKSASQLRECARCGRGYVHPARIYDGKLICNYCFQLLSPPTLEMTQYGEGYLFNKTLGCYEATMDVENFVECGWFVRRKTEERVDPYMGVKDVEYLLEYHGDRVCKKCPRYTFPDEYKLCPNMLCMDTV